MKKIARFFGNIIKLLGTLTFILIVAVIFTTLGYKAANQETIVANIILIPTQAQEFEANVKWLNGKEEKYTIKGDQFYIDAKILKWKSWVGFVGIKTWYEFDRIGGRYVSIEDEKSKPRSIIKLSRDKDYDLFRLRRDYPGLMVLLDAEYGSALYVLANQPMKFQLSVARTGLTLSGVNIDQLPTVNVN